MATCDISKENPFFEPRFFFNWVKERCDKKQIDLTKLDKSVVEELVERNAYYQKRIINLAFDRMFPIINLPSSSICLNLKKSNGWGDVVFMDKLSKIVADKIGASITGPGCYNYSQKMLEMHDLIIAGPALQFSSESPETVGKLLEINEYSLWTGKADIPSGPGADELGIFESEEHFQAFQIRPSLLDAIKDLKSSSLKGALSLTTSDTKIYFGYGHRYFIDFSKIITRWEGGKKSDTSPVIICLVEGGVFSSPEDSMRSRTHSYFEEQMKSEDSTFDGFSSISFQHIISKESDKCDIISKSYQLKKEGKPLHIITMSALTREDMLAMQRLSQPFAFVTGDQSLSEVISLVDKFWLYDLCPHKIKLLKTLCDRASSIFGKESLINSFLNIFVSEEKDKIEKVVSILNKNEELLLKQFRILNLTIKNEGNLGNNVCRKVIHMIIKRHMEKLKIAETEEVIHKEVFSAIIENRAPILDKHFFELHNKIQQAVVRELLVGHSIDSHSDIICDYLAVI